MKRITFLIISLLVVFSNVTFSMKKAAKKKAIKKKTSNNNKQARVVFAHGFGSDRSHGNSYQNAGMFPGCQVNVFDFPDSPRASGNNGKLNVKRVCFAQGQEVQVLQNAFNNNKKNYSNNVVAGVSRGAMCVLSADCPGASGRFAESPAASLKDIIEHKCKQFGFGWIPCLGRFIHRWLIRPFMFKNYNPKGDKPIDKVRNIPNNQPVLIAYTTKDNLIPASSSVKLAEELVKSGHTDVYLYGADVGSHSNIVLADIEKKIDDFVDVSNAFLKYCGALDQNYDCGNGDQLLAGCKVNDLNQVTALRKKLEWGNWKKYFKRNIVGFLVSAAVVGSAIFLGKKFIKRIFSKRVAKNQKKKSFFSLGC